MSASWTSKAFMIAALLLGAAGVTGAWRGTSSLADERQPGLLEQLDQAVVGVSEKGRPSVVQVVVRRAIGAEGTEGATRDQVAASGVVWGADGHIVSLGRAFETADSIEVLLASGETRPAELVGTDEDTGLALVKIDPKGLEQPLRAVTPGSASRLKAGSVVVAVTNPFGLTSSVSLGNVAGIHRVVKRGRMALTDVLQITTPVNPGDPGGLLLDARGEAVGIVASSYDRSLIDPDALGKLYKDILRLGENLFQRPPNEEPKRGAREDEARFSGSSGTLGGQGIGFAIPIEQVREVVERLKAGPLATRGYLGVQVVALEAGQAGVAVVGVKEGSPAEKAGLRQHDVVVRFGGKSVVTTRDFKRMVLEASLGAPIEVTVIRGDKTMGLLVTIEKRGVAMPQEARPQQEMRPPQQEKR